MCTHQMASTMPQRRYDLPDARTDGKVQLAAG